MCTNRAWLARGQRYKMKGGRDAHATFGLQYLFMDYRQKVPLGRTGLMVSRMGIGCSYGIDAISLTEAFERGINYFYFGTLRRQEMAKAIHRLTPAYREQLVLAIQSYARWPSVVSCSLDSALRTLRLDYADLLILGKFDKAPSVKLENELLKLRESGKVRFLAVSAHRRSMFAKYIVSGLFDVIMVRYSAAHRGAENDVFPLLPMQNRPGVISYTATRWGTLPPRLPATDCYRFALHHPAVDICLCGPKNREELAAALNVLSALPMNESEMENAKKIGDLAYSSKRKNIFQLLFE